MISVSRAASGQGQVPQVYAPQTTEAGYQLYAADMVERIKTIHALKQQRLTLQEIREHPALR